METFARENFIILEKCGWRKQTNKKSKVVISTETSPGNIMQSFILSYAPYTITWFFVFALQTVHRVP